jgi:uncharacterized protein
MFRSSCVALPVLVACLAASAAAQTPAAPTPAPGGPPAATAPAASPIVAPAGFLVVYKAGPAWKADVSSDVQLRDHGRYMFGLHQKKAMKAGGPFTNGTGGAALIEAESLAAAQAIVDADPAIVTKVFVAEVHAWSHVNWDELAKRFQPARPAQP